MTDPEGRERGRGRAAITHPRTKLEGMLGRGERMIRHAVTGEWVIVTPPPPARVIRVLAGR